MRGKEADIPDWVCLHNTSNPLNLCLLKLIFRHLHVHGIPVTAKLFRLTIYANGVSYKIEILRRSCLQGSLGFNVVLARG